MTKKRRIEYIVVHCTATKEGAKYDVNDVRRWHVQGNGWNDIGYHYLIGIDGECWKGRDESIVGAHVSGFNKFSIGVCYVGGLDANGKPKDTRTQKQKQTLYWLLKELKERYPLAAIVGHNDLNKGKACPSFEVKKEYNNIY